MKVSTQWLKDYVTLKPPVENIAERLTLAGLEVKKIKPLGSGHAMWDLEVTTTRPDWLSHYGVAREIAAVENVALKAPEIKKDLKRPMAPGWRVSALQCHR